MASSAATVPVSRASAHVSVTVSQTPAFPGDAPDPDIVSSGGTYYAFTTGTPLGNNLQALIDTTGNPTTGWRSYTGQSFGSTALPVPPAWETTNTQTSPGVFSFGGHWVMFYDASVSPNPADSGHSCLSVATAPALSPASPVFVDASSGPLVLRGRGRARPEPVRRSRHRRRLPVVEVQRREFGGAVPGVVGPTQPGRDQLRRDADGAADRGPGRSAVGDHRRRPADGVQRRGL